MTDNVFILQNLTQQQPLFLIKFELKPLAELVSAFLEAKICVTAKFKFSGRVAFE